MCDRLTIFMERRNGNRVEKGNMTNNLKTIATQKYMSYDLSQKPNVFFICKRSFHSFFLKHIRIMLVCQLNIMVAVYAFTDPKYVMRWHLTFFDISCSQTHSFHIISPSVFMSHSGDEELSKSKKLFIASMFLNTYFPMETLRTLAATIRILCVI